MNSFLSDIPWWTYPLIVAILAMFIRPEDLAVIVSFFLFGMFD